MSGLAFVFFGVAPFALFCSENGNGAVLCVIFLILGAICKGIETGFFKEMSTPKQKVTSEELWRSEFLKHYYRWKDVKGAYNSAEDSKQWADNAVRMHGGTPPTNERFESIAKEYGIKTQKSYKDRVEEINRVQVGKFYLMGKLAEKYKDYKVDYVSGYDYIIASRDRIRMAIASTVHYGYVGKNMEEEWRKLTYEEKNKAKQWVDEYEARFLRETEDFIKNKKPMPTIGKHYDTRFKGYGTMEIDEKYGFKINPW